MISRSPRILVIDNYDSFVFTVINYLRDAGAEVEVLRNDELSWEEFVERAQVADGVLISPGPGDPSSAGVSMDLIRWAAEQAKPLYGVCLGHQAIGEVYGARISRAAQQLHGKNSSVTHTDHPMFEAVPNPFTATRYHSLAAERDTVDETVLEVTATTAEGVPMAFAHRHLPIWGVQFHPEALMTEGGHEMLRNWVNTL